MTDQTQHQGGSRIRELIEAAERLIDKRQHEPLSMAQIAAEAGMSEDIARAVVPDEKAMVDTLSEIAMSHLLDAISRRTVVIDTADAGGRVRAIAEGFLEWAIERPHEFRLASDRTLVPLSSSAPLRRLNGSVRDLLLRSLKEAQAQGVLAEEHDLETLALTGRALVYGLARMSLDGHFEEWLDESGRLQVLDAARQSLGMYFDAIYTKD